MSIEVSQYCAVERDTTMILIIILIIILDSCHCSEDFNSRVRDFSLQLVDSTGLDNVVIAPFPIWSLMASLSLWTYGESQEQMSKVLKLPRNETIFLNEYSNLKKIIFEKKSTGVDISSGIYIFIKNDFHIFPSFKKKMTQHFGTVIETLNFNDTYEAAKTADNLIKNYIPGISNTLRPEDFFNTTMIMSTVTLFSAKWKSAFNVSFTTIEEFSLDNPDIYFVRMMHQRLQVPYSYMDSLNATAMELALGEDGKVSLLLIFPRSGTDIKEAYKTLYEITLKDIMDKLQSDVDKSGLKTIHLMLPRIKIESSMILNKPLSDIGIKDVCEPEKSSFLGMARDEIYIASIDYTCEIMIVEGGVYVKSTTPGYYGKGVRHSELPAEQPFIFFVIEKSTQTVMFGGLYSKARSDNFKAPDSLTSSNRV